MIAHHREGEAIDRENRRQKFQAIGDPSTPMFE